jgi:uncharacterized protein YqcC (DUF446 family)
MAPAKIYIEAAKRIDAIETEMRRIGAWQARRPPEEAFRSREPFFMDRMDYSTWLTFVFVPRVRDIIKARGEFPTGSMVGVQAVREFDGWEEGTELASLLSKFDSLIEAAAGKRGKAAVQQLENAAAAGKADKVRKLLAAGVQPTTTALTWAVSKGDPETARLLLDGGVACDARDDYGVTPVFFAAGAGNDGICSFLIDPDKWPPGALGPTHVRPGHVDTLRLLIERGAPFDEPYAAEPPYGSAGATPLIVAAAFGHDAAAAELRARGARVDAKDHKGRTAADWAKSARHPALAKKLRSR